MNDKNKQIGESCEHSNTKKKQTITKKPPTLSVPMKEDV